MKKEKIKQWFTRQKRSLLKKTFALASLPRQCQAYAFIDGIWSQPYDCQLPTRYKLYWKNRLINTSFSLEELKATPPHQTPEVDRERVFILGSGPSVNNLDLSKLKKEKVIFLNGAVTSITKVDNPFLEVISDASFVRNRSSLLTNLRNDLKFAVTFDVFRELALFDEKIAENYEFSIMNEYPNYKEKSAILNELARKFGEFLEEEAAGDLLSLFLDPRLGFFHTGTVMSNAIQIAFYLGFKEIFLLGFDLGNAGLPRFYERREDVVRSGLLNDYEEHIKPFMLLTKLASEKTGVAVYNCSPTTLLPYSIIPYRDFNSLFS